MKKAKKAKKQPACKTKQPEKASPRFAIGRLLSKKAAAFLCLVAAVGILSAGGTLAYLRMTTGATVNSFISSVVTCEVKETFNGLNKSNVAIKNTGDTDAYIRAYYLLSWRDAENNILPNCPDGYGYDLTELPDGENSRWKKGDDGYFYYLDPVAPDKTTQGSLLTCTMTTQEGAAAGYHLSVEIFAEAIQSRPSRAADEAWNREKMTT